MKFIINRQLPMQAENIEVTLPVFSVHHLDCHSIYRRIDQAPDGRLIMRIIETTSCGSYEETEEAKFKWKVIDSRLGGDGEYYLGMKSEFKSDEGEWEEASLRALGVVLSVRQLDKLGK